MLSCIFVNLNWIDLSTAAAIQEQVHEYKQSMFKYLKHLINQNRGKLQRMCFSIFCSKLLIFPLVPANKSRVWSCLWLFLYKSEQRCWLLPWIFVFQNTLLLPVLFNPILHLSGIGHLIRNWLPYMRLSHGVHTVYGDWSYCTKVTIYCETYPVS